MRRFNAFAVIDWSGARSRWQKGIAIAQCERGSEAPSLVPPSAAHWNRGAVLDWLLAQAEVRKDMLIGLDLSPALPFLDQQAYFPGWLESPVDARALWDLVDGLSESDEHLAVTSFVRHTEIKRHFRQHRDCGDLFGASSGRMRRCEAGQKLIEGVNPYSCFNLVGAAQVGKSSLTGMRVLNRLGRSIAVWPFDPIPPDGPVIVEIYTSIAARASLALPKGKSKILDGPTLDRALASFGSRPHTPLARYTDHATDAILTAAWLRHVAGRAELWSPAGLTPEVARTEGWTFGVV